MPYVPPTHEQLHEKTLSLQEELMKAMGCYKPPKYEDLVPKIKGMRDDYIARVGQKPDRYLGTNKPSPQHLLEIDSINHLVRSLTEPKLDDYKALLGALIYRYLVIAASYRETYQGQFWSYFGWTVEKTAMFGTIGDMLGITESNKLDDFSIATNCQKYLDYLHKKHATKDSDYVPKGEDTFFEQLQSRITGCRALSKPKSEQLKYVVEVQSVDSSLCKIASEVSKQFKLFSKAVFTDLKTQGKLSREEMLACIQKSKAKYTRLGELMIDYLLQRKTLTTGEQEQDKFEDDMNKGLATYCQYTLLGMYLMALEKLGTHYPRLTELFNAVMGIVPGVAMDEATYLAALSALENYLTLPVMDDLSDLAFSIWGGRQALQAEVLQALTYASMSMSLM